jgi:hypothetical protein
MSIYLPIYSYIIHRFNFMDYMAKQMPMRIFGNKLNTIPLIDFLAGT